MSFPNFPDACFPNLATVRLCDDRGNVEGGFNPVPGGPVTFRVSVQDRGTRRADLGGARVGVVDYVVYFPADPAARLSRPIRGGDQILWDGLILATLGPATNRGGFDWLWRVKCEHVAS